MKNKLNHFFGFLRDQMNGGQRILLKMKIHIKFV